MEINVPEDIYFPVDHDDIICIIQDYWKARISTNPINIYEEDGEGFGLE